MNGSEFNTCGDHISGRSAWSSFQLVDPVPGSAFSPARYEVFQFPPGTSPSDYQFNYDVNTQAGSFTDANGNVAPRVLAFTTGPLTLIPGGPIQQDNLYLYTNVSFNEPVSPAAPVGSILGIKPLGMSSLRQLTVVDCAPALTASIDAQPGIKTNPVAPSSSNPTLIILVKGSATLDVTKITGAAVGGASPVTTGIFGPLSKPADLTGDGKKDRLYFFRPSQTGLTCASTSVTIGGSLSGGGTWSGTDAIKPVACP